MTRSLTIAAVALTMALGAPVLAQVQLDHSTAQTLTELGIDTSQITQESDVGYINRILASDADAATQEGGDREAHRRGLTAASAAGPAQERGRRVAAGPGAWHRAAAAHISPPDHGGGG